MSRSGRRSGENAYEKAVEELNSFAVVPQLVLFNPEGVFWESNSGADVVPYPEVPGILSALRFKGVRIGVVAHTQQPYLTSTALSRLTHESFSPMISYGQEAEIVNALQEARRQTGINFADILYFDEKIAFTRAANNLGMTSHRLRGGLTLKHFEKGLQAFLDHHFDDRGF